MSMCRQGRPGAPAPLLHEVEGADGLRYRAFSVPVLTPPHEPAAPCFEADRGSTMTRKFFRRLLERLRAGTGSWRGRASIRDGSQQPLRTVRLASVRPSAQR